MRYVSVTTQEILSTREVRTALPGVSFRIGADLTDFGFAPLETVDPPAPAAREQIVEGAPEEYEPGKWRQTWETIPTPVPESVSALSGMLALEQAGLVSDFLRWKASLDPVQDFAALAYFEKSSEWRYNSPVIDAALQELGLAARKDALFQAAAALSV